MHSNTSPICFAGPRGRKIRFRAPGPEIGFRDPGPATAGLPQRVDVRGPWAAHAPAASLAAGQWNDAQEDAVDAQLPTCEQLHRATEASV